MRLTRDDLTHISSSRGIVLPALFFIWSIIAIITRWTLLPLGSGGTGVTGGTRRGNAIEVVEGTTAVWIGLIWLGVAVFLHGRYFWGWIEATHRTGIVVQWIGAGLAGGMLLWMIVRAMFGVFGG